MTINEFINWANLKLINIENKDNEINWILEELARISKVDVISKRNLKIENEKLLILKEAVLKRAKKYPLQYIFKNCNFMGLDFFIDERALIPRPETELIVQWGIKNILKNSKVLEIGSGSGCINISLKKNRPDLTITAVDISDAAISISKKNSQILLDKTKQIEYLRSDVFSDIKSEKYDIIISNPPYLTKQDMLIIDEELKSEPEIALSPGGDGLDVYRKIEKKSKHYLNKNGYIVLEIGYNIEGEVLKLFDGYKLVEKIIDFNGIVRVLVFSV